MTLSDFMQEVRLQLKQIEADVRKKQRDYPAHQPVEREPWEWWALLILELTRRAEVKR